MNRFTFTTAIVGVLATTAVALASSAGALSSGGEQATPRAVRAGGIGGISVAFSSCPADDSSQYRAPGGADPNVPFGTNPLVKYGTMPPVVYGANPVSAYGANPSVACGPDPYVPYGTNPLVTYGTNILGTYSLGLP